MIETPLVPTSWGDVIDKLTILEIKTARLADAAARANTSHEMGLLQEIAAPALSAPGLASLMAELKAVNESLWETEDAIRAQEAAGAFDARFIALARAVYQTNDRRAALKRRINQALGSALVEEKSYTPY